MCVEREKSLLHKAGAMSMIVPLSLVSTQRMQVMQELLENGRCRKVREWRKPLPTFDALGNAALVALAASPFGVGQHTSRPDRRVCEPA